MATEDLVLVIDEPHFTVKLHKSLLEVDLKEGIRKELEDALEANPTFRGSLGFLFQTVIPLDVSLKDIESATVDKKGRVKIVIPYRRDIIIPLKPNKSNKLVDKLHKLIPIEKQKEAERILASEEARKELERQRYEAEFRAPGEEPTTRRPL
jgi:hypothetical protein